MAIGATGPMTGRASTPKDTPRASVGRTSGSPARTPGADVAVLVHLGYLTGLRLQLVRRRTCRCQPGDDQALGRRAVPGLRQQRRLVAGRRAARHRRPMRCSARATLARWGRRLGVVRGAGCPSSTTTSSRPRAPCGSCCTASSRRSRRIAGRARADLEALARDHAAAADAARSSPRTTAPGACNGRRPTRGASASRSRSTPSRCSPTRRASRACAAARGPSCGWLFLDTSGRRRWCSMTTCGSRVKMRRLYERRRAGRTAPVTCRRDEGRAARVRDGVRRRQERRDGRHLPVAGPRRGPGRAVQGPEHGEQLGGHRERRRDRARAGAAGRGRGGRARGGHEPGAASSPRASATARSLLMGRRYADADAAQLPGRQARPARGGARRARRPARALRRRRHRGRRQPGRDQPARRRPRQHGPRARGRRPRRARRRHRPRRRLRLALRQPRAARARRPGARGRLRHQQVPRRRHDPRPRARAAAWR